jgi:hypothetical protein
MLKRHFYYYLVKPYLPWRLRMALRRVVAGWKRRKYHATWPINESASRKPHGWPGWPEGKQFAVVLTHDVEGPEGLAQARQLAELEMQLGFRSSFNFVPEGSYAVSPDLRSWLTAQEFEVGVHDLKHDGKLYVNQTQFRRHASRINDYLKAWNAVGFRSGFMHHHQEWLHDLDVRYDASTFDTDPFEPQPDGVDTIFPFWVPTPKGDIREHGGTRFLPLNGEDDGTPAETPAASAHTGPRKAGYVELPYTLPQDSTLFLLLRERTNDIWRRKLDWIVRHGGMVLVNVHPDYLYLKADGNSSVTIADHYADLLRYLSTTYPNRYWHVLPRDMALFVQQLKNRLSAIRP